MYLIYKTVSDKKSGTREMRMTTPPLVVSLTGKMVFESHVMDATGFVVEVLTVTK